MSNDTPEEGFVDCGYDASFWEACKLVIYITYTIAPPVCLLAGLPSHILALAAFLKHQSADTGFSYQILTTVTKILEILGMLLFSLFFYLGAGQDWSGEGAGNGPVWFMTNYNLMWFTAHLPPMIVASVTDIAVFASAATAADRVFALSKPFLYQKIRHKRHVAVATFLCFAIPLICELHLSFTFGVVTDANNTKYLVQYADFAISPVGVAWTNVTAVVRSIGELTLIVCSIFMIYRFKQRNRQVQELVGSDPTREARRKANERTLFFLALFQCIATTLPGFLITVWDVTNYFVPSFVYCGGTMLSPVTDLVLQVVNASDVYFMLCVSSNFRQMVKSVVAGGSQQKRNEFNSSQQNNNGRTGRRQQRNSVAWQ